MLGQIPVWADSCFATQTVRTDSVRADSVRADSGFTTGFLRADSVGACSVRAKYELFPLGQIPSLRSPDGWIDGRTECRPYLFSSRSRTRARGQ